MKSKFIFFDIKRNLIVNVLIILEVALWIFYAASLVSLINFDRSYRNRYNRSISIDNSKFMTFYKMILKENKDIEDYKNDIKESLELISKNNYTYGFIQRDLYTDIPIDVLGLNSKDLESNFTEKDTNDELIHPIGFNYGMIEHYQNNITQEISKEEWIRSDEYVPVIVGNDLAKKVKVGTSYVANNITYKIVGQFKKDVLAFDYTNSVDSSFLLNKSFVIPLSDETFFQNFGYQPITIFFNGDKENNSTELESNIRKISDDIVVSDFGDDLDKFLEEIKSKKYYEIFRIIIITIIASASIITTISYKITEDVDRIGILYSFGISKKDIFKTFSSEFLINILIGIIGGSLFYLKNCGSVYAFFINENLLFNLYISIGILLLTIILIMLMSFKEINKLTPKEMMGGFTE
ncbi:MULTISPECIES: FtsX-like permease family protein [unclassified Clostridium]|uniref:FtsX-like permease family protein n=1 Tax=unclassified Clostridium TaxID=2614128 RepID=UPI001EEAFFBC|nr:MULTISPECIES: FtsX-like permease family protein [unclassified Clostridium]